MIARLRALPRRVALSAYRQARSTLYEAWLTFVTLVTVAVITGLALWIGISQGWLDAIFSVG